MKQVLMILLLFLTGGAPLIQHRYYLIQLGKTWSDALTYCRTHHVDLATIYSDSDLVRLKAEAQKYPSIAEAWFGVYKELHGWRWSYRQESLGTFTQWAGSEPSNTGNKEECVAMDEYGLWNDVPCMWVVPFWCYDERNTGNNRYVYIAAAKTWNEAQSYCRQYHTDLASARDATENNILLGPEPIRKWTGLSRITWKWLDQSNPANITWYPGQPDNNQAFEDCGYLIFSQAADAQCSDIRYFYCHGIITGQIQNVKLKVKSDQNLKDAAVKAALLEKILQKLKEHGMEQNITLKWKETLGGDVFHKIEE